MELKLLDFISSTEREEEFYVLQGMNFLFLELMGKQLTFFFKKYFKNFNSNVFEKFLCKLIIQNDF